MKRLADLGTATAMLGVSLLLIASGAYHVGRWSGASRAITDAEAIAWAETNGWTRADLKAPQTPENAPDGVDMIAVGSGHVPAPAEDPLYRPAPDEPAMDAGGTAAMPDTHRAGAR